jgi:hypothetical protein
MDSKTSEIKLPNSGLRMRNPEWQAAIIKGIQEDPQNAYNFLESIKRKEEEFSSREAKYALIELILAQSREIERLKELTSINTYSPATLKRANRYLSFLETHKATIDNVIAAIQLLIGAWKILWIILGGIAILWSLWGVWDHFYHPIKQEPPASTLNQTSPYSSYDYNENKTHSHSLEDASLKRGDKSLKSPVSR